MGWRAIAAAGLAAGVAASASAAPLSGTNRAEPAKAAAPTMVERWATFAENRGYRIDFDDSKRVMTVSDSDRFEVFTPSSIVIRCTLEAMEPYLADTNEPMVVLRASNEDDAQTARDASDALGFGHRVLVFVETGTFAERRAVDARLSEAIVAAELARSMPRLSEWVADGLASAIAQDITGRAIIDGESMTTSQLRSCVARTYKKDAATKLDVTRISGRKPWEETAPLEAEAARCFDYLLETYPEEIPALVRDLGGIDPKPGVSRSETEDRLIDRTLGTSVRAELMDALRGR